LERPLPNQNKNTQSEMPAIYTLLRSMVLDGYFCSKQLFRDQRLNYINQNPLEEGFGEAPEHWVKSLQANMQD